MDKGLIKDRVSLVSPRSFWICVYECAQSFRHRHFYIWRILLAILKACLADGKGKLQTSATKLWATNVSVSSACTKRVQHPQSSLVLLPFEPFEPSALTLMICLRFLPPPCLINARKGNATECNAAFAALLLGSLKYHLLEEPGTRAIRKCLTASYSTSAKIARKRTRANINC